MYTIKFCFYTTLDNCLCLTKNIHKLNLTETHTYTDQEWWGRTVLWDDIVWNLDRQGDVLWEIWAAGTDLCRETFNIAWRVEASL